MHSIFQQFDFDHVPFPEDYKPFVSREYEGKLFRSPSEKGLPLICRGGNGLGDVISTVQFAFHVSELYLQPVGISWKAWKPKEQIKKKIEEVIPALGQSYSDRVFASDVDWKNYGKAMWPWYYSVPYFKTDKTWQGDDSRIAVLQLDGKSGGPNKNLPPEQVPELEEFLKSLGYTIKHLQFQNENGHYVSLASWVDTLVNAEIFFGVCSGGLHMAHCIGIPKVVFTNNYDYSILDPEKTSHRNESFIHFKNVQTMKEDIL